MADHSSHGKQVLTELAPLGRELRHAIPDVYKGFSELSKAAFAEGELDRKYKELIALAIGVVEGCDGCIASHSQSAERAGPTRQEAAEAIGVVEGCDGCIASHSQSAVRAGATRQEAAEAIGVTFLMHGGPATVYGARAYDAFCEFADALEAGEKPS